MTNNKKDMKTYGFTGKKIYGDERSNAPKSSIANLCGKGGDIHNCMRKTSKKKAIRRLLNKATRNYLKDTLITLLKQDRDKLPEHFVKRDYNLFERR